MLYNGFVVVDTRDSSGTESGYQSNDLDSNYDTPALPGGGGNTPPEMGGGLPGLGGGPLPSNSGGGKFSWLTPDVITGGLGVLGSVAGAAAARKANQNPDVAKIKAVCGRKPLFNIGGKKDKYFACAEKVMAPPPVFQQQQTGMSSSTKIIIGVLVFLVLVAIIITVIMMSKNKTVVPVKA
jgi:hypothetical protein